MAEENKPADKPLQPIIIKKVKKVVGGHHGGAWKVAYADLMTAMMAFFLVMWLVTVMLSSQQRAEVADYFKYKPIFKIMRHSLVDARAQRGGQLENAGSFHIDKKEKDLVMITMRELRDKLKAMVETNLADLKNQLEVQISDKGVTFELRDAPRSPMFVLGGKELTDQSKRVLRAVSDVVKGYGNKISVEGFTDTLEFAPQIASNWELSVAWASAARQEIEAHGIEKERFLFIAGYGSTKLLLKELPQDHRNRRIVITIFYPAY